MNSTVRSLFLITLMLFIALSPMFIGKLGLEDDHPDDGGLLVISNLPMTWFNGILDQQIPDLLKFGNSFFALFLVFLGGRSKAKRFNDRTIEPIKPLKVIFFETALFRAVFNFLFSNPNSGFTNCSPDQTFLYNHDSI